MRGLRAQCRSHVGASLAEPTPLSTRAQDPCAASSIALADLCVSRMSCFASPSAEVGRGWRWGWAGGFKMSNSALRCDTQSRPLDSRHASPVHHSMQNKNERRRRSTSHDHDARAASRTHGSRHHAMAPPSPITVHRSRSRVCAERRSVRYFSLTHTRRPFATPDAEYFTYMSHLLFQYPAYRYSYQYHSSTYILTTLQVQL